MVLLDAYELQRVHQDYWQKKRKRNIKHNQEVTAMFEARGGDSTEDMGVRIEEEKCKSSKQTTC